MSKNVFFFGFKNLTYPPHMSLCPLLWSCSRTWMWMCTSIAETVKYCDIIITFIIIAVFIMLYFLLALIAKQHTNLHHRIIISIIFITNILITTIALFLYSLLALIANNRLVCCGRVKSLPIDGVVWYVALRRKWTQSQMEQIMFTWRNEKNEEIL